MAEAEYFLTTLYRIERKLDRVLTLLADLEAKEMSMAGELDALKTSVAQTTSVEQSAVVLLKGLKAKLDEAIASGNPADLKALSTSLDTESKALADAVAANTPASPATPAKTKRP